jgi:spermidine synthase
MPKLLSAISTLLLLSLLSSSWAQAKVIHSERSLYRNILVEETGDVRCLKFNVKQAKSSQSCINKSHPQQLVFNYTKLLFSGLLLIDKPQRILIIGLGGGTMSNTLHQLFPDSQIDNVEIDPAVIKVARLYFDLFESDKVRALAQDGRIFVKRALLKKARYDWIILDAFNGDYIPEHLLTQEFLQETKQLLSERGILSANTFTTSNLYAHESATYQAVFGAFFNVRNDGHGNRIILTGIAQQPNLAQLKQKLPSLKQKLDPFNVNIYDIFDHISSSKQPDWPANTRILTDQFSPANLLNLE